MTNCLLGPQFLDGLYIIDFTVHVDLLYGLLVRSSVTVNNYLWVHFIFALGRILAVSSVGRLVY